MSDLEKQQVAYRIETGRLLLRCWKPADAPALREALGRSDQHLRPWIPFMKDEPRTLEQSAEWLRGHRSAFDLGLNFRYALFERETGTLAGEVVLLDRVGEGGLEIGYLVHVGFGGLGYATEATCALIRVAFELHKVDRIEIHCAPDNEPSAAIPARLGFEHEATLKRRIVDTEGETHDLMVWTLFAADCRASPAGQLKFRAYNCLGEVLFEAA